MIFIDNKYTRIYYTIIRRAKTRVLPTDSYKEVHHVFPKSFGGADSPDNLITLTAREHFVCHWLLTKMVTGSLQQKMIFAFTAMLKLKSKNQHRYTSKLTARLYEKYKIIDANIKKSTYRGRVKNTTKYKFCHTDGREEFCSLLDMSVKHNLLRSSLAHLVNKPEGKHHVKGWSLNYPMSTVIRSEQYVGPGGPNYDHTLYTFKHKNGTVEHCTKYELFTKYSLKRNGIYDICSGKQKSSQGWTLVTN